MATGLWSREQQALRLQRKFMICDFGPGLHAPESRYN